MSANVEITDTFDQWRTKSNEWLSMTQSGGSDNFIKLNNTTNSTSKTTGSIYSEGGIGIALPFAPPSYGTPGPSSVRWFAGGGAGGQSGEGGIGGGGDSQGGNGTGNTGGGGGSGHDGSNGGTGAAGIVIIGYPV